MQHFNSISNWKKTATLFLSGQAISLFGSAAVEFAIIWYITLTFKSATMMTISILCAFVPRLLISPFAGVWADRYHRKRIIIWADAGIALATLLLAIAYLSGYQELWLLLAVMCIRSLGTGIQNPAVGALLPQIVPEQHLLKVNGLNGSLQSLITLLAPAASGALLMNLSLGMIFFVDIITALAAIVITSVLKIKSHTISFEKGKPDYYGDLRQALIYVKNNPLVKRLLLLFGVFYFAITPAAFMPALYIARTFGDEVWRLTVFEVLFSGGMLVGGLIIARWGGFKNGMHSIAFSCLGIGITGIVLGLSGFYLFLASIAIMGIFVSFFGSVEITLIQESVPTEIQGRILGLQQIVATFVLPASMLIFGPLGDLIPIEIFFIFGGALIILLAIYAYRHPIVEKTIEE